MLGWTGTSLAAGIIVWAPTVEDLREAIAEVVAAENTDGAEWRADLDAAVLELSPKQGQAFYYWLRGFSQAEIAGFLGISQPAVCEYLQRVFEKFANLLDHNPINSADSEYKGIRARVEVTNGVHCCVCGRNLDGSSWLCRACAQAHNLTGSLDTWPAWAKELKNFELRERRYNARSFGRIVPLDCSDMG
jgi:predicted transcriptional regulator